jgi:tetratricopeptide (TPR) repeat protein
MEITMPESSGMSTPFEPAIDGVLGLILAERDLGGGRDGMQRRLSRLLAELATPDPARSPGELEDLVWALWISHPEPAAESLMARAVEALASGAFAEARPLLDELVASYPDWAEAWNKRATLAFVEDRDADAVSDITQTLLLEPRHFGAVAGFGQICLRHGHVHEARAAFTVALALNPHLDSIREMLEETTAVSPALH